MHTPLRPLAIVVFAAAIAVASTDRSTGDVQAKPAVVASRQGSIVVQAELQMAADDIWVDGANAFVQPDLVSLTDTAAITILDVKNPAAPKVVGTIRQKLDWFGRPGRMFMANGLIYLVVTRHDNQVSTLRIFDVRDPSRPYQIGSIPELPPLRSMFVEKDKAYFVGPIRTASGAVASCTWVISVGDPVNLHSGYAMCYEHSPDRESAISIVAQGDYAYELWSGGLRILDISKNTYPPEVANLALDLTDSLGTLRLSESRLYVDTSDGVLIIDIGNANSPAILGRYATARLGDFVIEDNILYAAPFTTSLDIVDVQAPASPLPLASFATSTWARRIAVSGRTIYVANHDTLLVLRHDPEPPQVTPTWAFLLYLDGDNNLSSWTESTVRALEGLANDSQVKVVALLDGPSTGDTVRYLVQPGGRYTDGVNRWRMGEINMGDPQSLSDFIDWSRRTVPTDKTLLVIDDHGRGTTGIAWDDTSGGDYLSVSELGSALKDATLDGSRPLDVIFYDACLMAMIENAHQVRNYAHYLVASQSIGWTSATTAIVARRVSNATTPRQLATDIVDSYQRALAPTGLPFTMSAVDLGRAELVAVRTSALADALIATLGSNKAAVASVRERTQKFDSQDYGAITSDDEYLDLRDFARLARETVPDPIVVATADQLVQAIDAFVVIERHQSGLDDGNLIALDGSRGTAIHFPPGPGGWGYDDYMRHAFPFTRDGRWDEFLQTYFDTLAVAPLRAVFPGIPPHRTPRQRVILPILLVSR